MEGRRLVSPAIRHRIECPEVDGAITYSQEDIETIIKSWLEASENQIPTWLEAQKIKFLLG